MTLVAGPVALETPAGVRRIDVETAEQMAEAVFAALPADAAMLVAAVADWRVEPSPTKLKKGAGPPKLQFRADARHPRGAWRESSSGRACSSASPPRRSDVVDQAIAKRSAKRADWIVANDVQGTSWAATATASTWSRRKASRTGPRRARTRLLDA